MSDVDYDDPAYVGLVRDADRDNRVGKHDFLVERVDSSPWPSGDARVKIVGQLLTASGARADLTWSPPPAPEVVKEESSGWEAKKKKAIASAIQIGQATKKYYGKSPADLQPGDTIKVQTAKTKMDAAGKGGFIRVVAVLDPAGITREGKVASEVPF